MTRFRALGATAATALAVSLLPAALPAGGGHDAQLLRSTVAGSLTTDPALFGVNPGGVPWVVDRGSVRLGRDGRLDVRVDGLVVPTRGDNPVPQLAASVVCNGAVVATTGTVPFSTGGDARIRAAVTVPDRCLAPAVLLNPNGNPAVYIAATGSEE